MVRKIIAWAWLLMAACLQPRSAIAQELDQQRFRDVKSAISQVDAPIIVFGDSIVQGAALPTSQCGHPLVNAGVTGAGIEYFQRHAIELLGASHPTLIVLAVGINNAWNDNDTSRLRSFRQTYRATVGVLAKIAPVAVTTITPIRPGALASSYNPSLVPELNTVIRTAPKRVAVFDVTKPLSAQNFTSDGIHLTRDGSTLWTRTLQNGIGRVLGCVTR